MNVPIRTSLLCSDVLPFALAGLLAVTACKGGDHAGASHSNGQQQGTPTVSQRPVDLPGGATQLAAPPFGAEAVGWLGGTLMIELPRSSAQDPVPLPWQDVTPTVPPKGAKLDPKVPAPQVEHRLIAPTLLIGRQDVRAGDQVITRMRCRADVAELCTAMGLQDHTGRQLLDFDPAGVDAQGHVTAISAAVEKNGWSGKPVAVLADRRLTFGAVQQALDTLRAAGAQPKLLVATLTGNLAQLWPNPTPASGTALPGVGTPTGETANSSGGAGPLPFDLTAFVVHVMRSGVHLELRRAAPNPAVTPELLGGLVEALSVWAERARVAVPALTTATIAYAADAPFEEVARTLDALRDTCARSNKGEPCHDRRVIFPQIELAVDAPAAATPAQAQ